MEKTLAYSLCLLLLISTEIGITDSSNFPSSQDHETNTEAGESPSKVMCAPGDSILYNGSCILCLAEALFGSDSMQNLTYYNCNSMALYDAEERLSILEGKRYLSGRTLQMTTVVRQPFVKMEDDGVFHGVVIEVLDALQRKYNFSRVIHLRKDGRWGDQLPNGTWVGMVGQVHDKEVDMGITGFSIIYSRTKAIDFSVPFHQEPTAILLPAPRATTKLTILVRPFRFEVWLAVLATIFTLGPSLYALHIASLRMQMSHSVGLKKKPLMNGELFCDVFQFMIGSLVQEGLKSPVQKTTRFIVILWWFFTLVLANIYTGYMVSFLSAPKLYDLVKDLEELVSQRELSWTYRNNTAVGSLFHSSTSGVYYKVKMGTAPSDLAENDQQGVDMVRSGKFAFLKEKSLLDVVLSQDFMDSNYTCRMTIAREKFFTVGFALILQKRSNYLKLINSEIGVALTTGLMQKWKDMHWPKHLECENAASYILETQPRTRRLNLDDCQGANFLLGCGLFLAVISFVGEVIKRRLCGCGNSSAVSLFGEVGRGGRKTSGEESENYKIIVIKVKEHYYDKMSSHGRTSFNPMLSTQEQ